MNRKRKRKRKDTMILSLCKAERFKRRAYPLIM